MQLPVEPEQGGWGGEGTGTGGERGMLLLGRAGVERRKKSMGAAARQEQREEEICREEGLAPGRRQEGHNRRVLGKRAR